MNNGVFFRRALKHQARQTIARFVAPCMMVSAGVLTFSMLAYLIQAYTGGLIFPYSLPTADFPIRTGIWSVSPELMATFGLGHLGSAGGVLAALRVDAAERIMAYVLPWTQIRPFLITTALVFLVSTPIRFGALTQLWQVTQGQGASPRGLFRWYTDLRLTGKALLVQFILGMWEWLIQLLCMLPAIALMIFSAQSDGDSLLWYAVLVLLLGGMALGYYLSLLFVPVRLLLTREPSLSVSAAFSRGLGAFRGHRGEFFLLWLSFLPWHLVSLLTYHVVDLFLFPYQSLTGMHFLSALEAPPPEAGQLDLESL